MHELLDFSEIRKQIEKDLSVLTAQQRRIEELAFASQPEGRNKIARDKISQHLAAIAPRTCIEDFLKYFSNAYFDTHKERKQSIVTAYLYALGVQELQESAQR